MISLHLVHCAFDDINGALIRDAFEGFSSLNVGIYLHPKKDERTTSSFLLVLAVSHLKAANV